MRSSKFLPFCRKEFEQNTNQGPTVLEMESKPWQKCYLLIWKANLHMRNTISNTELLMYVYSHVRMWELDHKESWVLSNWWFWTVVLEKALESPLDSKEIQAVDPKGNQSWIVTGRTDVEAEALILWPPDTKNWFIRKDPDARKDWRQEEKGMIEDKMVGWYHRLNGYEFEQALGIGDGQGSLVCCIPCGRKELDMTEQLNWTELMKRTFWLSLSV